MNAFFASAIVVISSGFIAADVESNSSPSVISASDSFNLGNGKKVFSKSCSGCHGSSGEGSFGPNLCDAYWIHGHHYHNILHVIRHGTNKGMTAFKHSLKHHDIRDVAHYVLSLKGSKLANAKSPEGKPAN